MEVRSFLHLGIAVAAVLTQVHWRGLVHKDIKPANILLNRTTDRSSSPVSGIASRLPRERQPPAPPESIAGTLAYMAPEQTGRMNRSIDARSDLYALPLRSTRCSRAHCRLPRPIPWSGSTAISPEAGAAKREAGDCPGRGLRSHHEALAKTEERYQTAAGLRIRRCRR
jgi:serine/threonine protein kinase